MSLLLSHWFPGSDVVPDCIDSWSLHPYLPWFFTVPQNQQNGADCHLKKWVSLYNWFSLRLQYLYDSKHPIWIAAVIVMLASCFRHILFIFSYLDMSYNCLRMNNSKVLKKFKSQESILSHWNGSFGMKAHVLNGFLHLLTNSLQLWPV